MQVIPLKRIFTRAARSFQAVLAVAAAIALCASASAAPSQPSSKTSSASPTKTASSTPSTQAAPGKATAPSNSAAQPAAAKQPAGAATKVVTQTTAPQTPSRSASPIQAQRPTDQMATVRARADVPTYRPSEIADARRPTFQPSSFSGLSSASQQRLARQQAVFSNQAASAQIVRRPTTSGWTWLFLFWALESDSKAHKLERDQRVLQQRFDDLSRQLQQTPDEYQHLKTVAAQLRPLDSEVDEDQLDALADSIPVALSASTSASVPTPAPAEAQRLPALERFVGDHPPEEILSRMFPVVACFVFVGIFLAVLKSVVF